jgi:predicted transcriptional regulator
MNIQLAFAFGMLVVIGVAMIVTIIICMLRVTYLQAELYDLETNTNKYLQNIERRLDDVYRELEQRIDKESQFMLHKTEEFDMSVHRRIDDVLSTVDSRFDKFENKIKGTTILKS